jgi:hypothetical protein
VVVTLAPRKREPERLHDLLQIEGVSNEPPDEAAVWVVPDVRDGGTNWGMVTALKLARRGIGGPPTVVAHAIPPGLPSSVDFSDDFIFADLIEVAEVAHPVGPY